jgi:tRNA G37 N-methylase Trm5
MSIVSETDSIGEQIDMAYDALEGCEEVMKYHARHGTPSLSILTQLNPKTAVETAEKLGAWLDGKDIIEIGAGVGFLAIEMARRAKSVIAIESDPAWSWIFTQSLYKHKPKNLTWVFGSAETMAGKLTADACLVFTRSGILEMRDIASRFSKVVLFPYQDLPDYFNRKVSLAEELVWRKIEGEMKT